MKKIILFCLCLALYLAPQSLVAAATPSDPAPAPAIETELKTQRMIPVSFIVMDGTGEVTPALRKEWRQAVRQAYRVPYYSLMTARDDSFVAEGIINSSGESTSQLDTTVFQQIAAEVQAQVIALMVIHRMDQQMVQGGWHWHDGPDTYIITTTSADLYVYKKDGDKLLKKIIRDVERREIGNDKKPEFIIKYAMMNLANKMENRPLI